MSHDPAWSAAQRTVIDELVRRVASGEHVVLYGPAGIGKTAMLDAAARRLAQGGVKAIAASTLRGLADLDAALARALPDIGADGTTRAFRSRVRAAAGRQRLALVLDHVEARGTAFKSELRRLRDEGVGAVLAIDVDVPRERDALRLARLGSTLIAAPEVPTLALRRLLVSRLLGAAHAASEQELRALAAAARGRPGWIVECAERWDQPAYRATNGLRRALLGGDIEVALWARAST